MGYESFIEKGTQNLKLKPECFERSMRFKFQVLA